MASAVLAIAAAATHEAGAQTVLPAWEQVWPQDTLPVAVGDTLLLQWVPPARDAVSYGITDLVMLRNNPYAQDSSTAPMDVHATLHISATKNPDHGHYVKALDQDSLMVVELWVGMRGAALYPAGLDSTLAMADADVMAFTGAHAMHVTLYALEVNTGGGWQPAAALPKGLLFDLNISWSQLPLVALAHAPGGLAAQWYDCAGTNTMATAQELEFSWNHLGGMEAYDVEWTWVDDYKALNGLPDGHMPTTQIAYDLARDATRVTVPGNTNRYRIPLLYDRGWIVWRVRGAAYSPTTPGAWVFTPWSNVAPEGYVSDVPPNSVKAVPGHQIKKNWQAASSFAEDGKRKEVVTYADGTTRSRQVVTRNNTLGAPIVGETVYDATGRPAMQVLPVPVMNEGCVAIGPDDWGPIEYKPNFNQEDSLTGPMPLTWADILGGCEVLGPQLDSASGAHYYYSGSYAAETGPVLEQAPSFIPRAEGKPYSHTEFTRDNTGRVRAQGGVGPAFQLGAHDTRSYYGVPGQTELNRLFGSEAGYARHYQKNLTIDPNGQTSVTYLDMAGRTVATALACGTPVGMDAVGTGGVSLTDDLFEGQASTAQDLQLRMDGPSLVFTTQFTVPCPDEYTFDYTLFPMLLTDACWEDFCAHCVYDLEIMLTDACGAEVFSHNAVAGSMQLESDGSITFVSSCTPKNPSTNTFQRTAEPLDVGEYTLTKRLSIHAPARDHYVAELLLPANNGCARTFEDFHADVFAQLDTSGCDVSCADCYAAIGSLETFLLDTPGATAHQYALLLAQCDELCKPESWCTAAYKTMLADVSWNGQYAKAEEIMTSGGLQYIAPDYLSVVHDNLSTSILRRGFMTNLTGAPWRTIQLSKPLWRQPLLETAMGWEEGYYEGNGDRTKIPVALINGTYVPPVADVNDVFDVDGETYVYPEKLANLHDFLVNFSMRSGWERSLVRFHPEFCYYQDCKSYGVQQDPQERFSSSDGFDARMRMAETYLDAQAPHPLGNLLDAAGVFQYLDDPFIQAGDGYAIALQNRVEEYVTVNGTSYSMMEMAAALVQCNGTFDPGCTIIPGSGPTAVQDAYWATLRGLYTSEKYRLQKERADAFVSSCDCPGMNVCIGESSTSTWWNRMHTPIAPFSWNVWTYDYANWFDYIHQYWANYYSQPGNMICQPCSNSNYSHYAGRVRRVPDPALIGGSINTPIDAAYQLYLQTGQCPVATSWVGMFQELLTAPGFDPNGTYDISESAAWLGVHLALNDLVPGVEVPQALAIFSTQGDELTMTVQYGDGTPDCIITLTGPTGIAWADIAFVQQIQALDGGDFMLGVHVSLGLGQGTEVFWLEGSGMCHALAPCNFPQQCTPNDLALHFQDLMNLMATLGHIDSEAALGSVQVPPAQGTPTVQSALGVSITSRFEPGMELLWKFEQSDPANPRLLLMDLNHGGECQYILDDLSLIDADPAGLTLAQCLAQAVFFQHITSDNANRFIVDVYGPTGLLGRLKGKAWFQCDGLPQPLPFGSCELPPPLSCQDGQYTVLTDLVSVLGEWIPAHQDQYEGVSLWESPYMTGSLAQAICPTCDGDWSPLHAAVEGNLVTVAECLSIDFDFPYGPVPFLGLGEAELHGEPDEEGAWHLIKIPLLASNGAQVGRLTVETCLDLYPCEPCPVLPPPPNPDPIPEPQDPPVSMLVDPVSGGLAAWSMLPDSLLRALGLIHSDTIWPGYLTYSQALDSLNHRLGLAQADSAFVVGMDYPAYRKWGMQHAVETYLRYIRNFRPEIDRSLLLHKSGAFVADYGNTVNVDKEYQRYLAVVEDYNLRAAAESKPAMELLPDSVFREMLYADKVADYIANLVEMPPLESPPLGLADYFALSGDSVPDDPCAQLYRNSYLPAYRAFEVANGDSTARCPDPRKYTPLVSLEEFRASNLCCSDSGLAVLAQYVQQLQSDSLKCPGALPRLKECPEPMQAVKVLPEPECQALYAQWVQTMEDYHNSDYWVMSQYALDFNIPFQDFFQKGWCACVVNYLEYIQLYIDWDDQLPKPPYPMHIDDFCNSDCKKAHEQWRTLMDKYNMPCAYVDVTGNDLPIGPLEDYGFFEREGLCDCVEAYKVYIGMYVNWQPSMPLPTPPLSIEAFCAQEPEGPDCCALTDSLKVTILEYYPQSDYYTEFGYPLIFEGNGCNEIEQNGLCDCLPAYLDYLAPYLIWPQGWPQGEPAPPAPMELAEFCNSISPGNPCDDSYAQYAAGLIALTPLLEEVEPGLLFDWASEALFTSAGMCYCVNEYLANAELQLTQALMFDPPDPSVVNFAEVVSITRFCQPTPQPCPPAPLTPVLPTITLLDPDPCPCCTALEAAAELEAIHLYNQYVDSLTSDITARYDSACMTALETFTKQYINTEHHYTLYYYDQAGNLVRTIPPAGVEVMNTTAPDDLVGMAISEDRANGTHTVFTNHRLASDHLYNSLGQPTRTAMPDQDRMDLWQTALPSGLPEWLQITGTWFGPGGTGYLTGWQDMGTGPDRAYAYRTADGGKSWQRLHGLLGEDLTDVHFPSATVGFATGGHGSLVRTLDGGSSWDLLTDNGLLGEGHDLTATVFATDQAGVVLGNNYSSFTADQGATFSAGTTVAGSPAFTGAGHDGTDYQATASAFEGYGNGAVLSAPQGGPWAATGAFGSLGADLACMASFTDLTETPPLTTVRAAGSLGVLLENNAPAADDWRMLPTGTTDAFRAIAFLDATHGVALMDSATGPSTTVGVLRHTQDGGQSWTAIGLPEFDLAAMFEAERSANSLGLVAVGTGGTVVRVLLGANGAGIIPMGGVSTDLDLTAVWAGRHGNNLYAVAGTSTGQVLATGQLGVGQQASWTAPHALANGSGPVSALAAAVVVPAAPPSVPLVSAVALRSAGTRSHLLWDFAAGTVSEQQQPVPGPATLLVPVSSTEVDAFNATDGSIQRVTLDDGLPFTEVAVAVSGTGPAQAPAALHAVPGGLWTAGTDGALFHAAENGGSYAWTDRSDRIRPLPLHAMDKGGQVAVGDQGLIYSHTATGWRSTPTGSTAALHAVSVAPSGVAVSAGGGGTAFSFDVTDPAATLQAVPLPVSVDITAASYTGTELTLGGPAGLLLYSPDLGQMPPTSLPPTNCGTVRALGHTAAGVMAVGDGSLVQRVVGTTRMSVHEVFIPRLNAVDFTNGTEGYVVGDKLTARHTTDGGLHWRTVPLPAPLATSALVPLNEVKMLPGGGASVVGNAGRTAEFQGEQWMPNPFIPVGTVGSTDLTALAVAPSGAAIATGINGSNGRYYHRDAGGVTWTATSTAGTPLYAAWNFPRIDGKDEFIVGGQAGFARRLVFPGGVFDDGDVDNNGIPDGQFQANVTGAGTIRAFFFHDHVAGFAVTADGELYRTDPTTTADHGTFAWGGTLAMNDGLDGQAQSGMWPATIGFSDRHHGFIGGSYNGTPVRYARTITDESGLYGQRFWYDALGRIVMSQNSKQFSADTALVPHRFSYSLYDELGRVYEAGELDDDSGADAFYHVPGMLVGGQFKPDVIDPVVLKTWVQQRDRREVTRTWYDEALPGLSIPGFPVADLRNLRLRVATTTYEEVHDGNDLTYDHASHYSYDIHGNVKHLVQDIPQLGQDGGSCSGCVDHRFKHLRYQYDLISGNVLQVNYQSGDDGMRHRYFYDADNRITEVKTSADGQVWYTDAEYFYYPHGPLRRVELGLPKVQGMDYAYTLQGWLKGINSDLLEPKTDMGQDGVAGTANASVGRDAYGMSIGYYGDNDYSAIDDARWDNQYGMRPFAAVGATGTLAGAHNPLYNGNIAHTVNSLQPWGGWTAPSQPAQVLAQVYRYDQLNRLKQAQGVEGLTVAANSWDGVTDAVANRYKSEYTYDANGNIKTADRFDETGTQYDDFAYQYHTAGGHLLQNRLYELYDESTATTGADIAHHPDAGNFDNTSTGVNQNNNYKYDELGNLIADTREEIHSIDWTVSGKVKRIGRTANSTKAELSFTYGADGQRISKTVGNPANGGHKEYYIRDAQGNIMATYKYTNNGSASLKLTERPIYGSSRIGSHTQEMEMIGSTPPQYYPYTQPMPAPKKRYELTDHLGNVNTVITGKLLPMAGGGYQADVVSAQGYEAFGSLLPGRNWDSNKYAYGFQGQEKDNEIYGAEGTALSFEYRVHDARVGRFLSIDPLSRKYPFYTPYSFSGNRVIDSREIEGLEPRQEIYGPDNLVPFLVVPASSTTQVPVHPGGLDYLKHKGPAPSAPLTWRQKAQLVDLVLPIEFWSNVLDDENINGSEATFGGTVLNTLGIIPIPGFKQMGLLRRAKFGDEFIDVVERAVKNSNGDDVTRSFVKHEDDLLKIADDAAGGSLDNFKEIKPGFYEGEVNGVRRKIEWQPGGEPHMGHGPHVKVMDWNPKAGKTKADGTPAGKWEVKSRYELDSE